MRNGKATTTNSAKAPRPKANVDWGMLDDLVGFHLRRAQSVVFDHFMRVIKDERITPGQFGVLTLIEENPGLNQSRLAGALGIERSTMVAVINVLEERDLVKRQESTADRRSYVLSLTRQGKALLGVVNGKVCDHEQQITAALNGSEKEVLVDLLKKISGSLG
ncbi:MAG: MarR family transcriptional regulator [Rhodospirillales bacterium]|nr:MarR family transcriptional regulator [Rhodospirillales bacterium]